MQRGPAASGIDAGRGAGIAAELGANPSGVAEDDRGRKSGLGHGRVLVQDPGGLTDLHVDAEAQKPHDVFWDRSVARVDLAHQCRPTGLTELACERQLRPGQRQRRRDSLQARDRSSVPALRRVQQLLRLAPRLIEVRVLRKFRHDISSVTRWSARRVWR